MRRLLAVALLLACRSPDPRPEPAPGSAGAPAEARPAPGSAGAPAEARPAPRPPDEMDEKMRHCPLALEGAASTLEEIEGGVRFTVRVPDGAVDEARRRARHVVEFAARRTREGHGGFDGKGGGRMKNCPVVTDDVAIAASDVPGGARLDVTSTTGQVDRLRAETRARASRFPFAGATIELAGRRGGEVSR